VTDTSKILKELVTGQCGCVPVGGLGEDTGGYKGYGFATIVEILSSCLQAGNFLLALTGVKVPFQASLLLSFSHVVISGWKESADRAWPLFHRDQHRVF